jgi:hypothetical protein
MGSAENMRAPRDPRLVAVPLVDLDGFIVVIARAGMRGTMLASRKPAPRSARRRCAFIARGCPGTSTGVIRHRQRRLAGPEYASRKDSLDQYLTILF